MKKLTYLLLAGIMGILSVNHLVAQEKRPDSPANQQEVPGVKDVGSTKEIQRHGVLLDSIQLNAARDPQGIVAVGDTIIIFSSDGVGNNYFDTYDFAGNHYREVKDTCTTGWGYRDLAYDGQYILASEDSTIKRIDPHTFAIVSFLTIGRKLARGLAYDPGENAIYITNWGIYDHLLKINATTGLFIKSYSETAGGPYGIAFDPYTQPGKASLWFTSQKSFSTDPFMLHRVDTANAKVNYVFDFKGQMPDSCREGGLDIVNNPAAFPGKVVALATDQKYNKLYFIDISGAGDVLPSALEVTDEIEGWEAVGETRDMIVNYPYLYAIESGNLSLYDISNNPGQPTLVKTDSAIGHRTGGYGGNKIFKYGDKLFITVTGPYPNGNKDDFTTIESYSITDPANPEYLNTLNVNLPIEHAVFDGNYIFLTHADAANLFSVVKWYADGTMEMVHQFQLTAGTFDEPAYPTDIKIDELYHLMFLSYHYTYTGIYPKGAISVYNILNVDAPELISWKDFIGDIPTALQILPDRGLAALINHEYNSTYSSLYCYEYSDLKKLNFLGLKRISDTHISFGLKMLRDNLLVVSVPDENVKTYYWDRQSTAFLDGPEADFDGGADIIPYSVPIAPVAFKNSQAPNPVNLQYFFALLRGYAPEFGWLVTGSEKTSIIKVVEPPKTGQWTLTMSIQPAEAASNGCSVTPAPGAHQYAKGAEVNVYAHPNPEKGWCFTGWTGNVSGKDLIQHVVMDADKIAVAHFGKLELTVSGKIGSNWYCPYKVKENSKLLELPFLVCASKADGWKLSKISFRHSGAGSPYPDISSVILQKGGTTVYTGNYGMDNTLNVTFNPPISIGPGQCVPFKLIYDFGFDPAGSTPPIFTIPYASDEPKTFHVETFGVVAVPENYDGGDILGKAHNDTLTFARVRNSQGYLFAKINDGVNAKSTRSGDTCSVCEGYYTETIQLSDTSKEITILSYDGPAKTVIYADNDKCSDFTMLLSGHAPKTVEGFTVSADSGTAIVIRHAHNSLIKENYIYAKDGISLYDTKTSKVESNIIHVDDHAIKLWKSNENKVSENIMASRNDTISPTIWLWKSNNNYLDNNQIWSVKSDSYGMWIKAEKSSYNKIANHSALTLSDRIHLIELTDYSKGNEILNNQNFIVKIHKNSDSSRIYGNSLENIRITGYSNAYTWIENNTISDGKAEGIYLSNPGILGTVFIKNNHISGHNGYGIWSDEVKTMIIKNDIYANGYDAPDGVQPGGIYLYQNRGSTITKNMINGNAGNGIKISNSSNISIEHNQITNHKEGTPGKYGTTAGINIINSEYPSGKIYVLDNYIAKNCTGIYYVGVDNDPNSQLITRGNSIENSFCLNTGIHIEKGAVTLAGNNIRNNHGNGILFKGGTVNQMAYNNILGNSEYGINNMTNHEIDAGTNYWGNATCPGSQDISGTVNSSGWLTAPFGIVAFPDKDTVFVSQDTSDSTLLYLQNLNNLNDALLVSIGDDKSWTTAVSQVQISLSDSIGWGYQVKYSVPPGTASDETTKVVYSVISVNGNDSTSGAFYLSVYKPKAAVIYLNHNKTTLQPGDTLQFHAQIFDQHNHPMGVPVKWESTAGVINDNGLFIAGQTEGETTVTVSDTSGTISSVANIYVSVQKPILTKIILSPDSVKLKPYQTIQFIASGFNQFGYPILFEKKWISSGNTSFIDSHGVFTAAGKAGIYHVVVQDTANTQSDTAVVIIEDVTGVEPTNSVSSGVKLSQNYPNPFRDKTQISFTLPKPADVWLSVFDINGREVSRLLKSRKPAGTCHLTFDAAHLPAGIYFYKLQVGGHVQMKKMVVVR